LDIEKRLQDAVQSYWNARAKNKEKQVKAGKSMQARAAKSPAAPKWVRSKSWLLTSYAMRD
jgi:hypothetical protein